MTQDHFSSSSSSKKTGGSFFPKPKRNSREKKEEAGVLQRRARPRRSLRHRSRSSCGARCVGFHRCRPSWKTPESGNRPLIFACFSKPKAKTNGTVSKRDRIRALVSFVSIHHAFWQVTRSMHLFSPLFERKTPTFNLDDATARLERHSELVRRRHLCTYMRIRKSLDVAYFSLSKKIQRPLETRKRYELKRAKSCCVI